FTVKIAAEISQRHAIYPAVQSVCVQAGNAAHGSDPDFRLLVFRNVDDVIVGNGVEVIYAVYKVINIGTIVTVKAVLGTYPYQAPAVFKYAPGFSYASFLQHRRVFNKHLGSFFSR